MLCDASGREVASKAVAKIADPQFWSAEHPVLYTALLTLKDPAGKTLEVIPQKVGFRRSEIRSGVYPWLAKPAPHSQAQLTAEDPCFFILNKLPIINGCRREYSHEIKARD